MMKRLASKEVCHLNRTPVLSLVGFSPQLHQQKAFAKLRYNPDQSTNIKNLNPSIGRLVDQFLPSQSLAIQPNAIVDHKGFKIPNQYLGDLSNVDYTFLSIYTKYKIDSVNDVLSILKEVVNGSNNENIKREDFATLCLKILELFCMNVCELENIAKQDYSMKLNKIVSLLNLSHLPELVKNITERIDGIDTKDARNIKYLIKNCDWFQFSRNPWFWAALEKSEEEFRVDLITCHPDNIKPNAIPINNYIDSLITNSEFEMLQQAHIIHERHGNFYLDAMKGLYDESQEVRRISYSIIMVNFSSSIDKSVETLLMSQKALANACEFESFYHLINRNDISDFREVLNTSLVELQQQLGEGNLSVSDLPYLRKTFLDDPIRRLSTKETIDGLQNLFKDLFKIEIKFIEKRTSAFNVEIKTRDEILISSGRLDLNNFAHSKSFAEDCRYFALQYEKDSEIQKFSIKEYFQNDSVTIENVVDLFIQLSKAIRYHIDDDSFSEIEFNKEEMFVIDRIMELTIRNEKVFLKYFYTDPADKENIKKLYNERSQRLSFIQNIEDQQKIMSQLNAHSFYTREDFKETEATKLCRETIFRNIKEQLYRVPDLTITGRDGHLLNQHFLKKQAKDIWNLYFSRDPLDTEKMLELFCSTPELKDEPRTRSKARAFFIYTLLFIIFSIIGYIFG